LEKETLAEVDRWVKSGRFPSRSRAIQMALTEMSARHRRRRLVEELGKLDRQQEQALADEVFTGETPWPEY
jgi:Arc/MetJ-type ribon-helix-helix transcriptional regulator